ncbi:MAG: YjjG family noncanonical pyrimidine nucleotidase [Cryomorphaceae bacterium]|nr:YjjG family noncanonical pyrimidine nucleotidase [Cryomorphaceae bacterium]
MSAKPHFIKDIFFDLDHTLWDFQKNSRETLEELFLQSSLPERSIAFEDFFQTYNRINDALWQTYREGKIKKEVLREIRFSQTLERFGVKDREEVSFFTEMYIQNSPLKKNLIPGTMELLEHLRDNDFKMHIITNGFREVQHTKLTRTGLYPFFSKVITSDDVGVNKPDSKIFHHALRAAEAKRNRSIMVGDHLLADIIGARRAGMQQAYYNPHRLSHSEKITIEIAELLELPAHLKVEK